MGFLVSVTTVLVVVISSVIASDSSSSNSRCSQPKLSGPCSWWSIRYYYDTTSGTCQLFYYGGCYGNENNFQTMADCQSSCGGDNICSLPLDTISSCDADQPRFYFDSQLRACRPFRYGGCDGNANNFKTLRECINSCGGICSVLPQQGLCTYYSWRFYYNTYFGTCLPYIYGGCLENSNSFVTFGECVHSCGSDICYHGVSYGSCGGAIQRYYFDSGTRTCKPFTYSGCGGNANNHATIRACKRTCGCYEPKKTGPCDAHIPKFYYHSESRSCKRFIYGGCNANANIFDTRQKCLRTCRW